MVTKKARSNSKCIQDNVRANLLQYMLCTQTAKAAMKQNRLRDKKVIAEIHIQAIYLLQATHVQHIHTLRRA